MRDLFNAARELQAFCRANAWPFCFIGGLAVWRWGKPRFTQDVDVTLLAGFSGEGKIVDAFLARYQSRVPNGRDLFIEQRVMRLTDATGVPIDVALGGLPFEELAVARASDFEYTPGEPLRVCSAEDLVVMKAFAGRPHDWGDIDAVLARSARVLAWNYVYEQLCPLAELKEAPELVSHLRALERKWRNDSLGEQSDGVMS
ncbi:MAG: nucleotidyl transferase AbiEii/AbiGii toxin family protein [Opitutaceae bacterium]